VCAQDRLDDELVAAPEWERLLVLINAPAVGDSHSFGPAEIDSCAQSTFSLLERCGLQLARRPDWTRVTTPSDFATKFPGTGGALYGAATEGWLASFQRPQ
jgi:1-hydroxycarotenoid 3,4-desaturase